MNEQAINEALDKANITAEQDKAIKGNKIKFAKLIRVCFKFCNPCKQIVAKGGNYQDKLCGKCKRVLRNIK